MEAMGISENDGELNMRAEEVEFVRIIQVLDDLAKELSGIDGIGFFPRDRVILPNVILFFSFAFLRRTRPRRCFRRCRSFRRILARYYRRCDQS
jgi:hypothetical protein